MRKVMLPLIALSVVFGCKKGATTADGVSIVTTQKIEQNANGEFSMESVVRTRLPGVVVPGIPITPTRPVRINTVAPTPRCISSYQELITILGTNRVVISMVILDNGTRLTPAAADLGNMIYTATDNRTSSSLFGSKLEVKWRDDAVSDWRGFSTDVWSAGCVYDKSFKGPFTCLIKGSEELLINTSMFWSVGVYSGEHIKDLVVQ